MHLVTEMQPYACMHTFSMGAYYMHTKQTPQLAVIQCTELLLSKLVLAQYLGTHMICASKYTG